MLIRVEIPIDAPGIDALLRRSFESDAEAKLVHDLREDGFLTLGLVATDDEGQVIGYVAFSPVDVQGEDLQWVGMAPLAVDEKYRHKGIGHAFFDHVKTIKQQKNFDSIELQVNARNEDAMKMYADYGFTPKSINMELTNYD